MHARAAGNPTKGQPMSIIDRLTVKNYKQVEWASEETDCFTASLYLDGSRIGSASNDGHGGPDYYDFKDAAAQAAFEEFVEAALASPEMQNDESNWINGTYCASDESLVQDACRRFRREQMMKRALKNRKGTDFTTCVLIEQTNGWMVDILTVSLHPHHNVGEVVSEKANEGDKVFVYTKEDGVMEYEAVAA